MVRKIDPEAPPALKEELANKSRTRRLRAITIIAAMGAVADLEGALIDRLADDDHLVRAEAARALADCPTPAVRQALEAALADRSLVVREAAEEALQRLPFATLEAPRPIFAPLPPLPAIFPQETPR